YLERDPVITHTIIRAPHRSYGRRKRTSTGIFKGFTGWQQWLLAHDSQPAHFFGALFSVSDNPVPGDNLYRQRANVGDTYGIGEHVMLPPGIAMLGHVTRNDVHCQFVRFHTYFASC